MRESTRRRGGGALGACVGLLVGATVSCSEPAGGSAAASASVRSAGSAPRPAEPTGAVSSARALPRERWDPASRPRTGAFLGDATEDFVGAFTTEDRRTELFAVDGATLQIAWRAEVPGVSYMDHQLRFTVVQGFVAWTTQDHRLHVLDAATGAELRVIELGHDVVIDRLCGPRTNDDSLLVPTKSGYDAIVHLASGRESNNSGLYPRPACPIVAPVIAPPPRVLSELPGALSPAPAPEHVYRPGHLVARPRRDEGARVLLALDDRGDVTWERTLPELRAVRDVQRQAEQLFVLGDSTSPPRSAVVAVAARTGELAWTTPLPCPASTFVTSPTRVYALTDGLQLHVLDAASGKLLGTFGDPDPGCP